MTAPLPLAGVIGFPIAHSRSPRLHAHWLRRYGIDGHYVPLQVGAADLEACLRLLPRMGFAGANITIPHKERALDLADRATPLARRIGAANTLTFTAHGIEADNTDAHGFTWNILDHAPDWMPRCAAILGAGGASRAVIAALQARGAGEIRVTNRNPDRSAALAAEFGVIAAPWAERSELLEGCDTLVNATSLGMRGQPVLDIALDALPGDAIVNDLVYTPLMTPLLQTAAQRGNRVIDGLGMLLHQAAPGFERWFGLKPAVDDSLRQEVLGT
ncbi:MAG: shikimate dehydrogenase AroE [Rhodobacteraceae bacterium HLUCCA12]|nr:MAG: shikimate dehydrogenase AroE [Rhodobacteraceae bacterium HLUCCA12]